MGAAQGTDPQARSSHKHVGAKGDYPLRYGACKRRRTRQQGGSRHRLQGLHWLSHWIRRLLVLQVAYGLEVRPLWVAADANPADDPSRDRPLRPQKPLPSEYRRLWHETRPKPARSEAELEEERAEGQMVRRPVAREYYAEKGPLKLFADKVLMPQLSSPTSMECASMSWLTWT